MTTTAQSAPAITLTKRQRDTLRVIQARQANHRTGPSLREVAAALGIAGNAAQRHVEGLRRAGKVESDTGHGLVVVKK